MAEPVQIGEVTKSLFLPEAEVECRCGEKFMSAFIQPDKKRPPFSVMDSCPLCQEERVDPVVLTNPNDRQYRIEHWGKICPERYREIRLHDLPNVAMNQDAETRAALKADKNFPKSRWKYEQLKPRVTDAGVKVLTNPQQAINEYQYGAKGLLFVGDIGTQKTRSMWVLIRKLWFSAEVIRDGKSRNVVSVKYFAPGEFFAEYMSTWERQIYEEWLKSICAVDILVFDDLGHEKLDGRAGDALYMILNGRMDNSLPTFATTNFDGGSLKDRLPPEKADQILRRISEHMDIVKSGVNSKDYKDWSAR